MRKKVDFGKYSHVVFNSFSLKVKYLLWLFVSNIFFLSNIPYPNTFRVFILRIFGASIGKNSVIKPWVKIKFPWELVLGDYVWLGENVWIDNLSKVTIGNHVCISQGALLLTGNHRYDQVGFNLESKPINIEDGVWICANSTIVGGVSLKSHSVVGLGCIVTKNLEPYKVLKHNEIIKDRLID